MGHPEMPISRNEGLNGSRWPAHAWRPTDVVKSIRPARHSVTHPVATRALPGVGEEGGTRSYICALPSVA
jgi:hypothetical protein